MRAAKPMSTIAKVYQLIKDGSVDSLNSFYFFAREMYLVRDIGGCLQCDSSRYSSMMWFLAVKK